MTASSQRCLKITQALLILVKWKKEKKELYYFQKLPPSDRVSLLEPGTYLSPNHLLFVSGKMKTTAVFELSLFSLKIPIKQWGSYYVVLFEIFHHNFSFTLLCTTNLSPSTQIVVYRRCTLLCSCSCSQNLYRWMQSKQKELWVSTNLYHECHVSVVERENFFQSITLHFSVNLYCQCLFTHQETMNVT